MANIKSEDTVIDGHPADEKHSIRLDLRSLMEMMSNSQESSASENEDREVLPQVSLPPWLLDRCLTCSDEWDDHPDFVVLRDNKPGSSDESQEGDDTTGCSETNALYEVDSALFEQLYGLVQPVVGGEDDVGAERITRDGARFAKNIIRLKARMPAAAECTAPFLRAVVKQFAKSIRSHLITLTRDDLEDLTDHLWQQEPDDDFSDDSSDSSDASTDDFFDKGNYMEVLFGRRELPPPPPPPRPPHLPYPPHRTRGPALPPAVVRTIPASAHKPTQEAMPRYGLTSDDKEEIPKIVTPREQLPPFARLLQALGKGISLASRPSPLIIHMFVDKDNLDDELRVDLRSAIENFSHKESILVIVSTETCLNNPTYTLSRFAPRSIKCIPWVFSYPMTVVPTRSASQVNLIKADGRIELKSRNIAALKRALRRHLPPHLNHTLLSPSADWDFLKGSRSDEILGKTSITDKDIETTRQMIGHSFLDEKIEQAVLFLGVKDKAVHAWDNLLNKSPPSPPMPVPGRPPAGHPYRGPPSPFRKLQLDPRNDMETSSAANGDDEWKDFPPATQKVLRDISLGPKGVWTKYHWERQFLHLLVAPSQIEARWSDLAIHPDAEKTIRELICQHADAGHSVSPYGILQRDRIRAALLYGPPGTGKTHLARVLARESGSSVIYVNPAELQSWIMPVGEPQKVLRGLFNLGKLLAPSIVIISEADVVFGARYSHTPYPEKSLAAQLLAEMDGLSKSQTAPLLMLCTNSPGDLDPAILRRVPSRIHLGLPSAALRVKIFDIVLRDEVLQPGLNPDLLARSTARFSGSDIRNLCVQAATMCTTFVEDGKDQGKRLLTWSLFQKALKKTCPTCTKDSLAGIRKFATKHDTVALENMEEDLDAEEDREEDYGFVEVPELRL